MGCDAVGWDAVLKGESCQCEFARGSDAGRREKNATY